MFNFTTQTILNTLEEGKNVIIQTEDKTPKVRINNLRFDPTNSNGSYAVKSVEVKLPQEEVLSHVTFDVADLDNHADKAVGGKISARFALYIGLTQTSVDSYYANAMVYKGKPFYVEFNYTPEGTNWSGEEDKALEKTAKIVCTADSPVLTISVDGTEVTFTCTNGYQIIREAALQVFDPTLVKIDCCSTDGGFTNVTKATQGTLSFKASDDNEYLLVEAEEESADDSAQDTGIIYPGAEAFGDYKWIMHNLRLPTTANYNYWSANKSELPAVGANYVQVTIKVCQDRENIGGMVVGQMTHSVTTHVLYVANTAANMTVLKKILGSEGLDVTIATSADSQLSSDQFSLD